MSPDCGVLQEAYLVFHDFLTWPEPYFSACKHLLNIIQQELKAPGKTQIQYNGIAAERIY